MNDVFENGAKFIQTSAGGVKPNYNREQAFRVADARTMKSLTKSVSALQCTPQSRCEAKSLKSKCE